MSRRFEFPVFIISTTGDTEKAKDVAAMFDNNAFEVNIITVKIPLALPKYGNSNEADSKTTYLFEQACKEAEKKYSDMDSLILFDTSTTNISPGRILSIIKSMIEASPGDIYYLADWLDHMDNKDDLINLVSPKDRKGRSVKLNTVARRTYSPNGLQAILLTSKCRRIILGEDELANGKSFPPLHTSLSRQLRENIEKGNLVAVTLHPSVFNFDITRSVDESDFLKMNPFSAFRSTLGKEDNPLPVFWFLIVVGLIIFFGLAAVAFRNIEDESREERSH